MNKCTERLYNGIIKENPTFILMLGMCPTLATTTSAINGLGMGLSTTAVLMFSNLIISLLRKIIPDRVRIPAFIVIVASLVTIVQLLIDVYKRQLLDFVASCQLISRSLALYVISVRRTRDLLTASFRFYLAIDTLAVRLYTSHYLGMFGTCTR